MKAVLIATASEKLTSTGTSQTLHTYHSSQCICNLGVKSSTLCDILSCGICQIVKSSFKAFAFGVPSNAGRYAFCYSARRQRLK